METALSDPRPVLIGAGLTRRLVEDWASSCNEFLGWQRREMVERKPAPEKLLEHREALKLMLRLGRSFHAQVSDPDFPLPELAAEVRGKLGQLEKSWDMIHNPMNDAEADALLQRAFPDAPGTGKPA